MLAHVRYVTTGEEGGDPIAFLVEVLGQPGTWLAFGAGLVALQTEDDYEEPDRPDAA